MSEEVEVNESVVNAMTPEEKQELAAYLQGYGAPVAEEKHNVHKFLNDVAKAKDTTKTGNLTQEEIGIPRFPLRTYKELAHIADKIMDNEYLKEYYLGKAEILTSTSLSKDAKLINLAIVQRRELGDVTPRPRKPSSSWFKAKEPAGSAE